MDETKNKTEKQDIKCERCQKAIGERTPTDVWPGDRTHVSIEKGWIYFQCPDDLSYTKVDKSTFDFALHRPGTKRIF